MNEINAIRDNKILSNHSIILAKSVHSRLCREEKFKRKGRQGPQRKTQRLIEDFFAKLCDLGVLCV
jgi:hypothetical protein